MCYIYPAIYLYINSYRNGSLLLAWFWRSEFKLCGSPRIIREVRFSIHYSSVLSCEFQQNCILQICAILLCFAGLSTWLTFSCCASFWVVNWYWQFFSKALNSFQSCKQSFFALLLLWRGWLGKKWVRMSK